MKYFLLALMFSFVFTGCSQSHLNKVYNSTGSLAISESLPIVYLDPSIEEEKVSILVQPSVQTQAIQSTKKDLWNALSKTVLFLGLLSGGAYLLLKLNRSAGFSRMSFFKNKNKESALRIKETRMLGSKQFLVVVEYNDQKILLATSPNGVHYLCSLNEKLKENMNVQDSKKYETLVEIF